jgi:hypothetical protein
MYQYTVTIDNYLKINEYLWIYDNYQHLLIDILIHIQMRYILKWKMYRRIHIRYRLSLKTFDLFCRYKTLTFIMKNTKLNIFFKYPKAFLKFHFFCIFIFVAKKKWYMASILILKIIKYHYQDSLFFQVKVTIFWA